MACTLWYEIPATMRFGEHLYTKEECCEPYPKLRELGESLKASGKIKRFRIKGYKGSKWHLVLWVN